MQDSPEKAAFFSGPGGAMKDEAITITIADIAVEGLSVADGIPSPYVSVRVGTVVHETVPRRHCSHATWPDSFSQGSEKNHCFLQSSSVESNQIFLKVVPRGEECIPSRRGFSERRDLCFSGTLDSHGFESGAG